MTPRVAFALSLICLGLAASPAAGQRAPDRPRLADGADTNSALAYYYFGLNALDKHPEIAADAFYWSTQLDPTAADGFYARRVALLLEDPYTLVRYWDGDEGTIKSKDVQKIDSLYYHALTLNPFLSEQLDRYMLDGVIDHLSNEIERRTGASSGEVRSELMQELFSAPPSFRAWQARVEGRAQEALGLYATAIGTADFKASLRIDRATLFYQIGQPDSALAELTAAAQEMRKRDNKDLVYVYDSKALLDERIAVVDLRLGNMTAARDALGQALQEDLSFSPAHIYLAYMARTANDSATALSEMDLAVQLRPDDPAPQFTYGSMLAEAGRLDDAALHLREAIKLDNVYAAPHFLLAQTLERQAKPADAAKEYATFLALAAANDPRRTAAQARIAALHGAPGAGGTGGGTPRRDHAPGVRQ